MQFIGNLFTECILALVSVFSDPIVTLPVVASIFISFVFWLLYKLVGGSDK